MNAGALIAGKYRLARTIGKGAMGTVWEATHEGTSRQVAVKLILEPTDELRLRLLREARAYGALRHRNIVEILDVGQTDDGDPFLVMQLLVGETLADLLARQRRLGVPEATRIARDVARALATAHAASIIHRDLKPANIFLHDEPGEDATVIKVVDFGVSKNLLASDGLSTVAGGMVGSPAYMSPEQAAAGTRGPVDHRADLWSLGVVLFEMLTGVRPLQGDANSIIAQIVSGQIPLVTSFVRTIDPKLATLVARCLDRDLAKRIGSAADLAVQLQAFTSASMGSGSSPLGQSASGMMSPFAQGQGARSDAEVIASPRGAYTSAPERNQSAPVLAPPPPRGAYASVPEKDHSAAPPRTQGGALAAGPSMPRADDDDSDDQATAKLGPIDMMRALRPAAPVPPPQMPPRGGTLPIQSNPALAPYNRGSMPSHHEVPPAPPSYNGNGTIPIQNDPAFGSGANWPKASPTTAKLDPNTPWPAESAVTNQGTVRIPPDFLKSIGASGGASPLAVPPAPPPPGPGFGTSSTSTTAPFTHQNARDASSANIALPPQKSRRTPLLVAGSAVGVALAILVAVVIGSKSGAGDAHSTAESAATASASVALVPPVPAPSAEPNAVAPQVAPPAPASAEPVAQVPPSIATAHPSAQSPTVASKAPAVAPPRSTGAKTPQSAAPAASVKSGKLPGFLSTPTKKINPKAP